MERKWQQRLNKGNNLIENDYLIWIICHQSQIIIKEVMKHSGSIQIRTDRKSPSGYEAWCAVHGLDYYFRILPELITGEEKRTKEKTLYWLLVKILSELISDKTKENKK